MLLPHTSTLKTGFYFHLFFPPNCTLHSPLLNSQLPAFWKVIWSLWQRRTKVNVKSRLQPCRLDESRPLDHQQWVGPTVAIKRNLGDPRSHKCRAAPLSFKHETTRLDPRYCQSVLFAYPCRCHCLFTAKAHKGTQGGKNPSSQPHSSICASMSGRSKRVTGKSPGDKMGLVSKESKEVQSQAG